ncbi:MAG: hypothetical protein NTW94_03600 [Legionellales bacterium]|nr:hypothetical protein [Legionellales bacterium]
MCAATVRHFDALAFVKRSKELGVKEDLAEYQARQLDQLIDIAMAINKEEFNTHELATKTDIKQLEVDLKTDIKQLEVDLKTDIKQLEVDLKTDIKQLEVKIEQYRYDALKFTVWTGIGVTVFLSGLLVKGFHWLT